MDHAFMSEQKHVLNREGHATTYLSEELLDVTLDPVAPKGLSN